MSRSWVYCSDNLWALLLVVHILIGIILVSIFFLCSSSPYQNFEDEIFVRWMECNTTPFPEYVLRYVFWFFLSYFFIFPHFYFYFIIIYIITWYRIWIFGFRIKLSLNPGPNPSVLLDLLSCPAFQNTLERRRDESRWRINVRKIPRVYALSLK